jgi:hypothetical protein
MMMQIDNTETVSVEKDEDWDLNLAIDEAYL